MRPRQQCRNDEADAFARAGRSKAKHMLWTIVPQISAVEAAEHDAIGSQKPGTPNLPRIGPARRAISCYMLSFSRPPDRKGDSDTHGCDPAACGDAPALDEDGRRVGVELEPPDEKDERLIDPPAPDREPGRPKLRLKGQTPGSPLGRRPEEGEHENGGDQQLAPKYLGPGHGQR